LGKEASSPAAAAKWREVHDLVVDGMSLADAMARSPETFPKVYTAMVQAGDYESAAKGMLQSLWARQTPERAARMAKQMRTGEWT
jgi:type II secretory pathway component PulF